MHDGYKFVPEREQPTDLERALALATRPVETEYPERDLREIFTFSKPNSSNRGTPLKVQCIIAKSASSPLEIILSFHSSKLVFFVHSISCEGELRISTACVMNIISHEYAYCLFPRATIHEHRSLMCCMTPNTAQPLALKKYQERGFTIVETTSPNQAGVDPGIPVGARYVGDSKCWTLPL